MDVSFDVKEDNFTKIYFSRGIHRLNCYHARSKITNQNKIILFHHNGVLRNTIGSSCLGQPNTPFDLSSSLSVAMSWSLSITYSKTNQSAMESIHTSDQNSVKVKHQSVNQQQHNQSSTMPR